MMSQYELQRSPVDGDDMEEKQKSFGWRIHTNMAERVRGQSGSDRCTTVTEADDRLGGAFGGVGAHWNEPALYMLTRSQGPPTTT